MSNTEPLAVVIVTHNHEATIGTTLDSVTTQTAPAEKILVVDCGSADTAWIKSWRGRPGLEPIELCRNAGFTGGNNAAWRRLNSHDGLVLFLNPDMVLDRDLFARLRGLLAEPRAQSFAAIGPRLLRWDVNENIVTDCVDSTGVFPHWTGTWRDRREGSPAVEDAIEEVPALCGAFLLARASALRRVQFKDGSLWDDRYFAYKEDIELSLRLRRFGFRVGVWHNVSAGHGRGWTRRAEMPRGARLLSARNECRLHADYAPLRWPISAAKWLYVRWLER